MGNNDNSSYYSKCCTVLSIATCHYAREFSKRHPLRSADLNRHDTMKMHIHNGPVDGINQGAANGRISAIVADQCGQVDA
jgi:hypothetical protein